MAGAVQPGWRNPQSGLADSQPRSDSWGLVSHLPQATKEAEHRDRLAELRARGDTARDRATSEQDTILTSRLRREQADKCEPPPHPSLAPQPDSTRPGLMPVLKPACARPC